MPTAGTKQRKQTGFHLMELTFQWEMKHRSQSMQIAIMPVLLCARGGEAGHGVAQCICSCIANYPQMQWLNSNDRSLSFMVSLDQKYRKKGPIEGGLSLMPGDSAGGLEAWVLELPESSLTPV